MNRQQHLVFTGMFIGIFIGVFIGAYLNRPTKIDYPNQAKQEQEVIDCEPATVVGYHDQTWWYQFEDLRIARATNRYFRSDKGKKVKVIYYKKGYFREPPITQVCR